MKKVTKSNHYRGNDRRVVTNLREEMSIDKRGLFVFQCITKYIDKENMEKGNLRGKRIEKPCMGL